MDSSIIRNKIESVITHPASRIGLLLGGVFLIASGLMSSNYDTSIIGFLFIVLELESMEKYKLKDEIKSLKSEKQQGL